MPGSSAAMGYDVATTRSELGTLLVDIPLFHCISSVTPGENESQLMPTIIDRVAMHVDGFSLSPGPSAP